MGKNIRNTNLRRIVWKKAKGRCAHCGREASPRTQTVDHYIPRSRGGTYDRRNLMPVCARCNWSRGSRKVNPEVYYQYAEAWAIRELKEYEREFNEKNKSME